MDESPAISPPAKKVGLPNPFRRMAQNPVILKELRGRMRGRRAFIDLTVYLILISLLILTIYAVMATQSSLTQFDPSFRQKVGKTIFGSVVLFEFLMIGFIGPALTAGAITSERERETFDVLRTTLLSARALVLGKLGAACMYIFLLVLTALPIEALAFLLGGVGMEEILVSSLMLFVNTIFFCALGLFCSSFTKRTLAATVTSYTLILLSLLGLGLMVFMLVQYESKIPYDDPLRDLVNLFAWLATSTNSLLAALVSEMFLIDNQTLFFGKAPFGTGIYVFSPWVLHIPLYLILSAIMVLSSILFVRRPDR